MIDLFHAAQIVQRVCTRHRWPFCFIGGLAVHRWGEPRLTQVVDLTILTGFGKERSVVTALLRRFEPRIEDALDFALQNRVLLVQTEEGIDIDISLGAMPFEEALVRRATPYRFLPRVKLLTCSAEDLIVLKAFADRPKDWVDVEGIVTRQRGKLRWSHIWAKLQLLVDLEGEPEILETLRRLKARPRHG